MEKQLLNVKKDNNRNDPKMKNIRLTTNEMKRC